MNISILYLYLSFLFFIFSYKFSFLASAHAVLPLLYVIKINSEEENIKFTKTELIAVLILILNLLIIPIAGVSWRELSFLTQFIFLIWIFNTNNIKFLDLLKFINVTFIIYSFLSYLVYFDYINPGFQNVGLNQHVEIAIGKTIYALPFRSLIGFGGSTAGIDSYSLLVIFLNILYFKQQRHPIIMIALGLLNVILALRLTPVITLVIILSYYLIQKVTGKRFTTIMTTAFFLSPFIPLILSSLEFVNQIFLIAVTHGRNLVWSKYYYTLAESDFSNLLFGFRSQRLPSIFVDQFDRYFINPHSSYLRILYSFGIPMYITLWIFLVYQIKRIQSEKALLIIWVVFSAATTNVNILFNFNPVWLFVLFYFIMGDRWDQNLNEK